MLGWEYAGWLKHRLLGAYHLSEVGQAPSAELEDQGQAQLHRGGVLALGQRRRACDQSPWGGERQVTRRVRPMRSEVVFASG